LPQTGAGQEKPMPVVHWLPEIVALEFFDGGAKNLVARLNPIRHANDQPLS
jgi:hypothetical protein